MIAIYTHTRWKITSSVGMREDVLANAQIFKQILSLVKDYFSVQGAVILKSSP